MRPIATPIRRRRTGSRGRHKRRRRTNLDGLVYVRRFLLKVAAYLVVAQLIADVLFVVLLTEGAMHPYLVLQMMADRNPAPSFEMLRDAPGNRDRLRIGQHYRDGLGHAAVQVSITASDGTTLYGTWTLPRRGASKAVILCHGFGDSSMNTADYSLLLLGNGFGVLTPDSRGHGASEGRNTFGIREAGDIVQWVRAIKSFSHISDIYGLGESLGGAILLQSLERGADFRAVVAESPFASFLEIANEKAGDFLGVGLGSLVVRQCFLYARWVHQVDLNEAQPVRSVVHSRVPILLIHGEDDGFIQPKHSFEIARANPAIQLWFVPMARHTLSFEVAPVEFQTRVVEWFNR